MEADIWSLALQVRQKWLDEELGVINPDLDPLTKSVRDRLAPDFVAFLEIAGLPDEPDSLLIEWWDPSSWEVIDDSLLIFADYLIQSHLYALWLGGTEAGKIAAHDGTKPLQSIGTTAAFLTAYLADDHVLYP